MNCITFYDKEKMDDFIHLDEKYLATLLADPKKKYRNVYCVNCGEKGHVVKSCNGPITSFGIIAFKVVNSPDEEKYDKNEKLQKTLQKTKISNMIESNYPKIKFLMIQRKDTMGYIDFVRGKYPEHDLEEKARLLSVCLHEMTSQEKHNLLTKTFDEIWSELWLNHNSKCFKNEYEMAKRKFTNLDVHALVRNSETFFDFQEFGFPKGRRNMRENNIACAEREFYEETGYDKSCYEFIKNYPTVHEEFLGTNGIRYRHIYYLVKMKDNIPPPMIDATNIVQTGEVQNIGWLTYDECMAVARPYDNAKKRVLTKVYTDILNMGNHFVCSNFYYNNRKAMNGYVYKRSPVHDYRAVLL